MIVEVTVKQPVIPAPSIVITMDIETAKALREMLSWDMTIPEAIYPIDNEKRAELLTLMHRVFKPLATALKDK